MKSSFSRYVLYCVVSLSVILASGTALADVTSVTPATIPNRVATLAEGDSGTRSMLLFNVVCDAPTTISEISIFLEGANLDAQGPSIPDGYERGVRAVSLFNADSNGVTAGLAFTGAQVFNENYVNQPSNPIKQFNGIVWGQGTQIYLNLLPGNNYFLVVYDFSAPNSQPTGVTRNYAGERYWVRLESLKQINGTTSVTNLMGPQIYITGTVVGTTFESLYTVYNDRTQTGLSVDPTVILAVKVTTTNTAATWNDFLLRSSGSGDDTRVATLEVYEDTTGEGLYSPTSLGPPEDALVTKVDIPFITNNGQVYHIFPTPIAIPAYTSKIFFFCYTFDPTAPHATNNGFKLSVVNFGGNFKILEPYIITELESSTLTLLPLPPGIDIAVGSVDPPITYVYNTPTLTERFPLMQVKLTAHGMDAQLTDVTFAYTVTSTGQATTLYALELWLDANNSGSGWVDASDILLSTITRDAILANPAFFHFYLTQALRINDRSFANVLLVGIFTDKATAAYGFTLFGDGFDGNFDYVRFYPVIAPLYSNWLIFVTTPPVDPTPTPTPTVTVTNPLPPVNDGGTGSGGSAGNDTGVGIPGSIVDGTGGSGCFVATAAFGSANSTIVEALCAFRDSSLASGNALSVVKLYYQVGPGMAEALRCSPAARAFVREQLLPLVLLAR
jgi:hypothetical protein